MAPVHDKLSAVIVTTPQAVALLDAMKCLSFTRAVNLPVVGLIENMSGYVCPCCGEVTNIFSTGGGQSLATREGLPFLGSLPVDTELVTLLDAAEDAQGAAGQADGDGGAQDVAPPDFALLQRYMKTRTWPLFRVIADNAIANIGATELPET